MREQLLQRARLRRAASARRDRRRARHAARPRSRWPGCSPSRRWSRRSPAPPRIEQLDELLACGRLELCARELERLRSASGLSGVGVREAERLAVGVADRQRPHRPRRPRAVLAPSSPRGARRAASERRRRPRARTRSRAAPARCRGRRSRRRSARSSARCGGGSRRPTGRRPMAAAPARSKPSALAVEGARPRDVGDLQVHVADARPRRHRRRRRPAASASRSSRSSASVTIRTPRPSGGLLPALARAVGVDLDPEAVGVAQVQRLRDAVVGGALERPAALREAPRVSASAARVGCSHATWKRPVARRGQGRGAASCASTSAGLRVGAERALGRPRGRSAGARARARRSRRCAEIADGERHRADPQSWVDPAHSCKRRTPSGACGGVPGD